MLMVKQCSAGQRLTIMSDPCWLTEVTIAREIRPGQISKTSRITHRKMKNIQYNHGNKNQTPYSPKHYIALLRVSKATPKRPCFILFKK